MKLTKLRNYESTYHGPHASRKRPTLYMGKTPQADISICRINKNGGQKTAVSVSEGIGLSG